MISFKPIKDEYFWEDFILSQTPNIFLQSWAWHEFHLRCLAKSFPFFFMEDNKVVGAALFIKEKARRATYLTCPGGPIINWQNPRHLRAFTDLSRQLAQKENCLFLRIRPSVLKSPSIIQALRANKFLKAPMHMHAQNTWQLDLSQSEAEILKGMRKNTRSAIKKALRSGLTIEKSQQPEAVDLLYSLQLETARRQHFVPFPLVFLKTQFASFQSRNQAAIFLVRYQKQIINAAMIIFYGDTAVYHYSGSKNGFGKIPAAYLLQWEAIKEAKKRHCRIYNFWGIAPPGAKNHRFAGVTIFKKGFGGFPVNYVPAFDLPFSSYYWLDYLFETIRRKLRRL